MGVKLIDKLAYVDDIEKFNSQEHLLQADTDELVSATEAFGMVVNTAKTKVMRVSGDPASRNVQLTIKGEPVENVDSFVYLGSLLTSDNDCSKSIKRRLGLASASFKNLLPIWKNKTLSTSLKVRLFNSLIIPIALYSSETWSIKADDERRISAFETKCLRRIAGITYIDRVSNEDLRKLLRCPRTIMDRVRSQQLRWLGHIQRMSANQLPKITFEGRVHGTRSRDQPHKRWTDNFPAHNLPQLLRLAPDRSNYRRHIHHFLRREEAPIQPQRPGGT